MNSNEYPPTEKKEAQDGSIEMNPSKIAEKIFRLGDSTYARFGLTPDDEVLPDDIYKLAKVTQAKGPEIVEGILGQLEGCSDEEKMDKVKSLAWHDLFHGAVAFERTGGERFESIFLTLEDDVEKAVHEESMREELDALFWDTVLDKRYNLFAATTSLPAVRDYKASWVDKFYPKDEDNNPITEPHNWTEEQKDQQPYKWDVAQNLDLLEAGFESGEISPEMAFQAYQDMIISIVREINIEQILDLDKTDDEKEVLRRRLEDTITKILDDPDERTVERFNRLWHSYPEDKQVILREFLDMTEGIWSK